MTYAGSSFRVSTVVISLGSTSSTARQPNRVDEIAAPALVLVVLLAAVWWKALGSREEDLIGVLRSSLCAVLACSPVFSLQYAGWLTPWAAIAGRDPRRVPIASA
jgi:hypothetical protein